MLNSHWSWYYLSPYIEESKKIIEEVILTYQLRPNGTVIEVDWEYVLNVKKCHEKVHQGYIQLSK